MPPAPLPSGEGGRRPGEGSTALGDPTLGGKRLLATFRLHEVAKLEVFLVSWDFVSWHCNFSDYVSKQATTSPFRPT